MWRPPFLPRALARCRLCRAPGTLLCPACRDTLPWIGPACSQCGLPLPGAPDRARCGTCLRRPPAFDAACVPLRYAPPIDRLIAAFKFRGDLAAGALLADLLADAARERAVDLLVPVPLHPARRRERGFNQSAELARHLAAARGVDWRPRGLERLRDTPSQRGADRRRRLGNLRGAFAWRGGPLPPRVALIDDVVTTGATAHAAADALRRAGAERVEIWAAARTPPPE